MAGLLFPSRLSDSTAAYEFVLRDPRTGGNYAVQVKTGEAEIGLENLANAKNLDGWVVFSTTGAYRGRKPRHVETLDVGAITDFMRARASALPPIVDTWVRRAINGIESAGH